MGNCEARQARWHYSETDKKCMPFYYSGCGGNGNSFVSLDECEGKCPRQISKLVTIMFLITLYFEYLVLLLRDYKL